MNKFLIWILGLITFFRKLLKGYNRWFYNNLIWDVFLVEYVADRIIKKRNWFILLCLSTNGKYKGDVNCTHILIEYYLKGEKYTAVLRPNDLKNSFFPITIVKNPKIMISANIVGAVRRDITDTLNKYIGPAGDFHINKFSAIGNITWEQFFVLEGIYLGGFDTLELMDNSCEEKKFTLNRSFLESVVIRNEIVI